MGMRRLCSVLHGCGTDKQRRGISLRECCIISLIECFIIAIILGFIRLTVCVSLGITIIVCRRELSCRVIATRVCVAFSLGAGSFLRLSRDGRRARA